MRLALIAAIVFLAAVASANPANMKHRKNSILRSTFVHKSKTDRPRKSMVWTILKHVRKNFAKLFYMMSDDDPKAKCHDLECPDYEVKIKKDDYELRCYRSYYWAATNYTGDEEPESEMFMRLFDYIEGENKEETKIDMTVPVATKVEALTGTSKRFTMYFYIPSEYQMSRPQPTNPKVYIIHDPASCAYVRTYGGYSNDKKVEENLSELVASLRKDGITDYMEPSTLYVTAGYDSPWTVFGRTNEVWLLQK